VWRKRKGWEGREEGKKTGGRDGEGGKRDGRGMESRGQGWSLGQNLLK